MSTKKKRQHHVWKNYLKAWEVGGTVGCLMGDGFFATDPINLAVEGDFYKIPKLTETDLTMIRWLVIRPATNPYTKRHHEDFLNLLTAADRFVDANRRFLNNIGEIEASLNELRTNVLEDQHEGTESSFQPILDMLYHEDISFYDDDEMVITFFQYIAMQHMRTKGVKTETIASSKAKNGLDLTRIWDIMSQMFSTNIGASLYVERRKRKLILLKNSTNIEFITGDQPTVNLHSSAGKPVATLLLYYPVSPTLALILTETDGQTPFRTEGLTAGQVRHLNARMAKASHRQIYGRSEATLRQAQADALSL